MRWCCPALAFLRGQRALSGARLAEEIARHPAIHGEVECGGEAEPLVLRRIPQQRRLRGALKLGERAVVVELGEARADLRAQQLVQAPHAPQARGLVPRVRAKHDVADALDGRREQRELARRVLAEIGRAHV